MAGRKTPKLGKATRKNAAKVPAPRSSKTAEWRPTPEERLSVEQMRCVGEPIDTIARALKVDIKTLRKHCASELEDGRANRRREIVGKMFEAARDGNVTAQKRIEEMSRLADTSERVIKRGEPETKRPEPAVGKKEQRQRAAQAIGGKFAPPSGPQLKVVAGGKANPTPAADR